MLKHLFGLLPAPIVRSIGDSSFASLKERGSISTWMVGVRSENANTPDPEDWSLDDFEPDPEDVLEGEEPNFDNGFIENYIDRQIAKIPSFGDGARWRLASYLDLFDYDDLNPDGTLTDSQRSAVDAWVREYQEA